MTEGRIDKALSGFYYVDDGTSLTACRGRGKLRHAKVTPLVGDRVEFTPLDNGQGAIDAILPRKNQFQRPAVANIDQMVIIASGAIPVSDPFLLDRIISLAESKGCQPILCINKWDLVQAQDLLDLYRGAGIPTLPVSAQTGQGLEELRGMLAGKLSAFTGNSGVGKSSILNALDPTFALATGEISEKLGRGRHTTRHVELFSLGQDTYVIDTPGFASFDTQELDLELKEHLPETFPEFAPYVGGCRFVGCSHTKEKGCAVLEAVHQGKIPRSRHASYLRLYNELKDLKAWDKK